MKFPRLAATRLHTEGTARIESVGAVMCVKLGKFDHGFRLRIPPVPPGARIEVPCANESLPKTLTSRPTGL